MKIEYFGHSCFRLTAKNGTSVLTDPYTNVGYEMPLDLKADIVTVSHEHFDHNYTNGVEGQKIVSKPRLYTFNGIEIWGENSFHDEEKGRLRGENIIFKIKMDGITVCHFGDLGEKYSAATAEKLLGADIWLIPIGGTYTIDTKQAIEYIENLKPKAVIPMHYLPKDGVLDISDEKEFLARYTDALVGYYKELNFTVEDLVGQTTTVYFMERQYNDK